MEQKERNILKMIFLSSFFVFGLFMEYAACIYTAVYGIYFGIGLYRKRVWKFYWNLESAVVLTVAGFSLLSVFYGVDRGMSLIGFVRFLGVLFFFGILMQISEEDRWELLQGIPMVGVVMTGIGAVSYLIKPLREFFYVSDRLGGFFQYPNVFGVFCLIGMIWTICGMDLKRESGRRKKSMAVAAVLAVGILLSGSRTVFVLMVLALLVLAVRSRSLRKPLLIGVVLLAAVVGVSFFMGASQNIGRILTASFSSSTLIGRVIYVLDALKLIWKHPFGLGYLGYFYKEPEIQTALYSVRFVHNDFLQLALDVGWIPCFLMLALFVKNIVSRNNLFASRLILLIWGFHLLMDFDLEFMAMWYLLLLFLNCSYGRREKSFPGGMRRGLCAASVAVGVMALYLGAGMIPRYLGRADISSALLPFYTESNTELLAKETDIGKAEMLALRIRRQNSYVPEAYDILALAAYTEADYEAVSAYKKQSLHLQKYNMEAYEKYLMLLSQAISLESGQNDADDVVYLLGCVAEVPQMLEEVEAETTPLAYKTRDIPEFELSQELQEYIQMAQELLR